MHDIICPHCSKAFKVDETGYADILKQVRDSEFEDQIHARLELAEQDKRNAVELAKSQLAIQLLAEQAAKDLEIQDLKGKLESGEASKKLAVNEAKTAIERERDALINQLEQLKQDKLSAVQLIEAKLLADLQDEKAKKDSEIQDLKAKLEKTEVAQKLAITQAVMVVEKERDDLKNGLSQVSLEKQLSENALKDKFETQIKDREDTIERLKDMKARLSTKMVGETLEQHCEIEFNRARSMAFPRAYFEKDNDARSGSKGDYIFRDTDEAGLEIVSIMSVSYTHLTLPTICSV